MYSKFRIFDLGYYLSKFNLSRLCFGVFYALSAFFFFRTLKKLSKNAHNFQQHERSMQIMHQQHLWFVYSNSFIQVFVVYSSTSDLSKLKQSCTIRICVPITGKQKSIPRVVHYYICSCCIQNNPYPALVVLYSTLRIGLQGSGFFPSFSCFPKVNDFPVLILQFHNIMASNEIHCAA